MNKTKSRFHYTDEKDMETTPEKAVRITMLSFDQNEKISNRIACIATHQTNWRLLLTEQMES